MALSISQLQEKIDARNLRERGLLFGCLLAIIFLLWNVLFQSSLNKTQTALETRLTDLKTQQQTLTTQVAGITLAMASDPDLEKKNHVAQLKAEIKILDDMLSGLSQGLISADNLPRLLQDVLEKSATLRLLHMQTLPVEGLSWEQISTPEINSTASGTKSNQAPTSAGIYKHSVVLRLSGSYFELIDFLQLLESSQWHFYWEQLDYRVADYPKADILLRVYTLGAEKGRIGV